VRVADAAAGADHLRRRNDGPGRIRLPNAAAAASTTAGYLPGWNDPAGRLDLPGAAAAPTAAATAPRG